MKVVLMGKEVGNHDGAEIVDDGEGEVGIQFSNFRPLLEYNHIPLCDYLYVDLILGEFKEYNNDGEVQSTGKVFKS